MSFNVVLGDFKMQLWAVDKRFQMFLHFRDALYLMSLSWRFQYYYKRNSYKHITVICIVTDCPWKITFRAVSASDVVQVHTFRNEHSHIMDDVVTSQPIARSNGATVVIGAKV